MNFKWTVLFLVHASDNYTRKYANELFGILASTHYSEEVCVLVLYGSLQTYKSEAVSIQVILKELINQDLKDVKSYGYIDMGDDKKLGPIFSDIKDNYPSDRTLLFTWDHGSGFGIFNTTPLERNTIKQGLNLPEQDSTPTDICDTGTEKRVTFPEDNYQLSIIASQLLEEVHTRGLKGMNDIEKKKVKTSMLTNDELRNIIKHHSENNKVDLLIMMNCMMQMIETGYALHDAVEYLVAPETCIFWAGYNYKAIINKLCAEPEIETEIIARYAIDTIKPYYESTTFKKGFNDLVVSLVKPAKSEAVKEAIDHIAHDLCDDLNAVEDDVKRTRRNCEDLSQKYVTGVPYHYIDFVHYIFCLGERSNRLKIDIGKIKEVTGDYVVYILKGNNYSKENEDRIGVVNGFTIYFPTNPNEAYNDYYYEWFYKEGKHQTRFADQSKWKNFLIKYFKGHLY